MKVTIKMYQELEAISKMDMDEIEKSQLLLQAITGKSYTYLENLPRKKYNALCKKINQSFEIANQKMMKSRPRNLVRANGKWYWLNYEIAKPPMNTGRYVEIATFSTDIIGNLHKIMATMATPVKFTWRGIVPLEKREYTDHERIANDMLHLEFKHAYNSALFFWGVFTKSILNSQNYFLSIAENKEQVMQVLNRLQEISVGFTQPKWLQNMKVSV